MLEEFYDDVTEREKVFLHQSFYETFANYHNWTL